MKRAHRRTHIGTILGATLVSLSAGCSGGLIANLTEERQGDITVLIINNTPYRASFSLGSYDALDRDPPGAVDFVQQRVEGHTTAAVITLQCKRNVALGTADLIQRARDTDEDEAADFDPDAFSENVNFSSAPADSDLAASPTAGYAEGREVLLGVDYSCGDQLIFTLEEDATAAGGFRVDFYLLPDEEEDS